MIEDDREERLRRDAPVFDVAPVTRRRALPRLLVVAVIVAVVAFVGGLAVASPDPTLVRRLASPPAPASPAVAAASATAPTAGPEATPVTPVDQAATATRSSPTAPPGSSDFATGFDLAAVLAGVPGAEACEVGRPQQKEAPRTRLDGPRLTFQRSWLVTCRIPAAERQTFLVGLFGVLKGHIPAETFSYGTTLEGAGSALYPYAETPMAGTVALHADAAGRLLAIVLVLEEWRTG